MVTGVVVDAGPDVADDWIAERVGAADVVITADIPLAGRVLKAGGQAIHPTGRVFTTDNIGAALASRGPMPHCGLATLGLFADLDDPLPAHGGLIELPTAPGLGVDWRP